MEAPACSVSSDKVPCRKMSQSSATFPEERLQPWLSGTLLPFWADAGFDRAHGAFVEKFEPSGEASREDYTRVRVQARQIYVFSHAAVAGFGEVGLDRARQAFAFLEAHAWDGEQGGWFQRLRRSQTTAAGAALPAESAIPSSPSPTSARAGGLPPPWPGRS